MVSFSYRPLSRDFFPSVGVPSVIVGLMLMLIPSAVQAQGFLVASQPEAAFRLPRPLPSPDQPRPGEPAALYDIARLEIDASIRGQVAEVQVGQTFKNCSSQTLQVRFVFPLPYDGAIDQMTFLVDGQELEGKLLEADKAREIYQSYVRRSLDPALVQWIGFGMFQTQVFPVPPGAERTVTLRYTQLCRRTKSLTDWTLPLSPAKFTSKPIGELAIRGRIRSDQKLGNVYSPSHEVEIDRDGGQVARFEFVAKQYVPETDFRLLWDTGEEPVQMSLVAYRPEEDQDGYFMLMIQPRLPESSRGKESAGKNMVLVLDKSGSMRGEKIDQARRAASQVIDKLQGRDHFTIITYDSKVETFRSALDQADAETRDDAGEFIDSILAGGSTNIDEALSKAIKVARDADGPVYIVFMTDGQPTVGETNAMKIAANAKSALQDGMRLFSVGVGHDVNSRLLDKLASICLGQTTYVRPGQPLDEAITGLWNRLGAPALTDAQLEILVDGKEGRTSQLYPSDMYDLFSGDQLVIVGRYRKPGEVQIRLTGNFQGESKTFEFEDELPELTGSGTNVFVERLWATRRIGQIIDDIDLHGENAELVDELILLSKRHGILTPYTAYLAEEATDLNDSRRIRGLTTERLSRLGEEAGESAFRQRLYKGSMKFAERGASPSDQFGDGLVEERMHSLSLGSNPAPRLSAASEPATADFAGGDAASGLVPARRALSERVKQVGTKTFYLRDGRYIDSQANDKQIAEAIEIERFSDAYFDLLAKMDDSEKALLAEDRELIVVLDDKTYKIKVGEAP